MRKTWLGLALVVAMLGGCRGTPTGDAASPDFWLWGDWELSAIEGKDVLEGLPEGTRRPALSLAPDGSVSGTGGVNSLHGSLSPAGLSSGEFRIGEIAMTRMVGPPEAMTLERRFTRLLEGAGTFAKAGEDLVIQGRSKAPAMRFVRAP
ncbi:MAG: META domain-containing protein [Phycisphaeraceae bacterium]|nr:META domain-containing protein [Phycisphaeraceae bacterium]